MPLVHNVPSLIPPRLLCTLSRLSLGTWFREDALGDERTLGGFRNEGIELGLSHQASRGGSCSVLT